jgi:hypothetical protein
MRLPGLLLLSVGALLNAGPVLSETRVAGSVVVTEAVDDDLYVAGGKVLIESAIAGAAVLAAGSAEVAGDVEGDVMLAGGRITLDGGVGDDLRAAGGTVLISGFVTDQASIAGGTVELQSGSAIGGRTWIAANRVEMAGQVGDDLRIYAGTAVISGKVVGNVEISAREIRVERDAVIGGDLVWRSEQPPTISEDAQILGEVRATGDDASDGRESLLDEASGPFDAGRFAGGWALGIAIAAAALVLSWFAPGLVGRSATVFRAAPGRTLMLGAASLVLTPIMAFVLFVTLLGWLLGLVVLAGYVFGLVLSGLVGVLIIVRTLQDRFAAAGAPPAGGWQWFVLLLLVVAGLILAQRVQVLGPLISLTLVLAGFGALTALVTGRVTGSNAGSSAAS